MRKTVIDPDIVRSDSRTEQVWLDLEEMAKVEVTSEDPSFPVESALLSGKGPGWRAAQRGKQTLASSSTSQRGSAGSDWSFRRRKSRGPKSSLFSGRPSQADHSERSFANSGVSARKARQVK